MAAATVLAYRAALWLLAGLIEEEAARLCSKQSAVVAAAEQRETSDKLLNRCFRHGIFILVPVLLVNLLKAWCSSLISAETLTAAQKLAENFGGTVGTCLLLGDLCNGWWADQVAKAAHRIAVASSSSGSLP